MDEEDSSTNTTDHLQLMQSQIGDRYFDLQALAEGARAMLEQLPGDQAVAACRILSCLILEADRYFNECEAAFDRILKTQEAAQ